MSEFEKPKYIVIEGTDGAGTTTQKDLLAEYLTAQGRKVVEVVEPGGTPIGMRIREILKDASLERDPKTNLDLFTICRREIARQVIDTTLNEGSDVLSDRNWLSSVAYQGFGEGLDAEKIIDISRGALGEYFNPNHTLIIDLPVEVSYSRVLSRGGKEADYFEQKGSEFFEKVRQGYLWSAEKFCYPVIDGTQEIQKVHEDILRTLGQFAVKL